MALTVQCFNCGRTLKVKLDFAGRTIRCPSCQSPLKVPLAEDEFGDLEEEDHEIEDHRSPKQRRRSSSSDSSIVEKVAPFAPYWFLGTPLISGIVALLHPMLGAGIGLLTLVAGVLLAAYGFLFAVLVDPVYALSPIARMTRSDAERKRIGKKMAPYFRSFGKGLLITAMGCVSVWISFELQSRSDGNAAMRQMAESREREERRSPPGTSTGSPFHPEVRNNSSSYPSGGAATTAAETAPGTPPPAMPATHADDGQPPSPRPDDVPVQPFPGQPPLVPSPPPSTTRPVTPPVPREQLVPNAVMFAWINNGWRPVIIQKVISENRVSAIVPVISADGQSQTTETQELSIDDLRTPNPGEIQTKP